MNEGAWFGLLAALIGFGLAVWIGLLMAKRREKMAKQESVEVVRCSVLMMTGVWRRIRITSVVIRSDGYLLAYSSGSLVAAFASGAWAGFETETVLIGDPSDGMHGLTTQGNSAVTEQ